MLGIKEDFQAVVFTLGRENYALPIHNVQEIIRMPKVIALPCKAPYYLGISNLRGQIVPVLDLGQKLIGNPSHFDDNTRVIVIECGPSTLGITVDAVKEVVNISRDCIVDAPEVGKGQGSQLVGIARLADQLVLLLDIEKTLLN
ncbi:MAG: chemotaxis protein CheW [Methylocystaceae bacterium]